MYTFESVITLYLGNQINHSPSWILLSDPNLFSDTGENLRAQFAFITNKEELFLVLMRGRLENGEITGTQVP
jgi:hypothetical protein